MILIVILISVFQFNNSVIEWSSKKCISWDMYKSKIPSSSKFSAITKIEVQMEITEYASDSSSFKVYTKLIPEESWVKSDRTEHLLQHEQTHFNIAKVYSVILENELNYCCYFDSNSELIDLLFSKYNDKISNLQTAYDIETNYSKNIPCQYEWNEYVNKKLDSLGLGGLK